LAGGEGTAPQAPWSAAEELNQAAPQPAKQSRSARTEWRERALPHSKALRAQAGINPSRYFEGVLESFLNFHIGGYRNGGN